MDGSLQKVIRWKRRDYTVSTHRTSPVASEHPATRRKGVVCGKYYRNHWLRARSTQMVFASRGDSRIESQAKTPELKKQWVVLYTGASHRSLDHQWAGGIIPFPGFKSEAPLSELRNSHDEFHGMPRRPLQGAGGSIQSREPRAPAVQFLQGDTKIHWCIGIASDKGDFLQGHSANIQGSLVVHEPDMYNDCPGFCTLHAGLAGNGTADRIKDKVIGIGTGGRLHRVESVAVCMGLDSSSAQRIGFGKVNLEHPPCPGESGQ